MPLSSCNGTFSEHSGFDYLKKIFDTELSLSNDESSGGFT